MKAILVMEMPDNCAECPCSDECVDMCRQMESVITEEVNGECDKPSWCPLVPMPERKSETEKTTYGFGDYDFPLLRENHENIGWNACLDAIEGREEDG